MATGEETKTADLVESPDREGAASRATPCAACGSPVDSLARFCPACGTPTGDATPDDPEPGGGLPQPPVEAIGREKGPPAAGDPQGAEHARAGDVAPGDARHFRCDNCGAEVATSPDQRSYVCPFCDSTYVVELPPTVSGRQTPEFIIGFSVARDAARKIFRRWVAENRWFRPGDLRTAEIVDRLQGIYLPFWSFSMVAASRWSAQIGEYWYRTVTTTTFRNGKPVVRTRQVRETEWWPLEGEHHQYLRRYLISASGGLPQEEALRIGPFRLDALHRYAPYFLAGWMCEEYSFARNEAETKCREAFRRQAQQGVVAFLPGDTNRNVQVETEFSHTGSDLLLLPVYVASYRYRDKVFRVLINGQTGRVVGDKPISRRRIGVAVAVGLILLGLAALAIWFAGG